MNQPTRINPSIQIEYSDWWFKENADSIETWFNPETFSWHYDDGARLLVEYCYDSFEYWWDQKEVQAGKISHLTQISLFRYCTEYFLHWFNETTFGTRHKATVAGHKYELKEHCLQWIDHWYDSDIFMLTKDQILAKALYGD